LVPSALGSLTAEFGMGSGSGPPLLPPGRLRTGIESRSSAAATSSVTAPIMAFGQAGRSHLQGALAKSHQAPKPLGIEDERRSSSHEQLVPVSSTHRCAYTPGLSTWWSSTALKGELVSRWVSRLDAFSDYPVRTWLPCYAAGATTGPLEVRPSRSSRTKDRSSQFSYTYGR